MGPPSEILRAVTRVNSGYGSGALGGSALCHAGRGVGRPYGCAGGAVVGIAHDRYRRVGESIGGTDVLAAGENADHSRRKLPAATLERGYGDPYRAAGTRCDDNVATGRCFGIEW